MKKQLATKAIGLREPQARGGFTLIEVLVVIGIIAILAAIVIIAINPGRQFAQARNSQRTSNLNTYLNAIGQNMADNKGIFTCTSATLPVSTASTSVDKDSGGSGKDLSCLTPTYIPAGLPTDPTYTSGVDTLYDISVDSVGRVMICAPLSAEAALGTPSALCVVR